MTHHQPRAPSAPSSALAEEVRRRRTFAIISHPDAGKTTLTEKLLLFGGAIQMAGHVKARGERRRTRSDWMAIEQARGISVTSSVMTFERGGTVFNLLDTPGHADFSEDTYRTLSAVDAAIMVLDAAKGIESQTLKLFEACRLRGIPILTFVNKVDRPGLDPLELLDEVARTLALDLTPMTWPIGLGPDFRGCIDLPAARLLLPEGDRFSHYGRPVPLPAPAPVADLDALPEVEEWISRPALDGVRLAVGALPAFDLTAFREGDLSPVFFGSALRDFAVDALLNALELWVPPPLPRLAGARLILPEEEPVTGFVFKVQANMDPHHRDRVAYMRICSGRFRRGMRLFNARERRFVGVNAPLLFFAQDRETADEAFPGDIIGIPNHGTIRVGDTFSEGEELSFRGLPDFAPELLRRVVIVDPIRVKQLNNALHDLAEEGVVQVFEPISGMPTLIGVVGALQLEVLQSRLHHEYGVPVRYETAGYETARWVAAEESVAERFIDAERRNLARDRDGALVILARNAWTLRQAEADWPELRFTTTRERGTD